MTKCDGKSVMGCGTTETRAGRAGRSDHDAPAPRSAAISDLEAVLIVLLITGIIGFGAWSRPARPHGTDSARFQSEAHDWCDTSNERFC